MGDIVAYQQWLAERQIKHHFVNNYWCAALAHELEENKLDDSFKIPYFIVEEELTKEDNNVNLENAHISNALRHWLIYLLNARKMQANVLNYEEVLRDFIDKTLPSRVSNPLNISTSFHNLPTECKLWIFYSLRVYDKSPSIPRKILKDPLGNYYYIVPDCRMYVHLAQRQQTSLSIDEERLSKEPWGSLYRFVHSQPCFLLCENEDEWNAMWKLFLSFKLSHLFYALRAEMPVKLFALNTNIMKKDEQRRDFEEVLIKLAPIPKARRVLPKKQIAASTEEENVNEIKTNLESIVVEEPMIPTKPTEAKPKKISNQMMGKCWNFPQCPLFDRCKYVHPRNPCTKFPNCPRGWECLFLHEFCPNDAACEEPNCAYEHLNSITTYYRMAREPEEWIPRPIALVPPTMRKSSSELDKIDPASITPAIDKAGFTQQKRKRCQNFPQCKKEGTCAHFHPTQNCRKLAAGLKCPGQWCLFKHGPCPVDGECDDLKCIYEHYKSSPVVVRRYAAKQKQGFMARTASISDLTMDRMKSNGSLSRATSFSNLSMVESNAPLSRSNSMSNISVRSRRKSVTFADDSDGECIITTPSRKGSNNQKPVGILRSTTVTSKERCSFFPRCKNKHCEFAHPTEKCPAFPKCPNGGACLYLHGVCEKDGVCSRRNCDSEHNLPHEVDNPWCKNGSLCERVDCKFLHPKECVGRCPTPGDCWMYHRPKPSAAAAARPAIPLPVTPFQQDPGYQGPGYPTGPGYGPMPLFGYGPNFMHAPQSFAPGYGPGPGYPVRPVMVPGGYGPNTGYPTGYGAEPQFGYGNYGVPAGYAQPGPYGPGFPGYGPSQGYPSPLEGFGLTRPDQQPRPTTSGSTIPAQSPPPSYEQLSSAEQSFLGGKARSEVTRF